MTKYVLLVLGIWLFNSMLIKNFTRVHDAVGIQKFFDLFHQSEAFTMLFLHKLFLSDSNSMLSGCRPTTFQGKMNDLLLCLSNLLPLRLVFRIPQNLHMKIAASRMAKGITLAILSSQHSSGPIPPYPGILRWEQPCRSPEDKNQDCLP